MRKHYYYIWQGTLYKGSVYAYNLGEAMKKARRKVRGEFHLITGGIPH